MTDSNLTASENGFLAIDQLRLWLDHGSRGLGKEIYLHRSCNGKIEAQIHWADLVTSLIPGNTLSVEGTLEKVGECGSLLIQGKSCERLLRLILGT